MSAFVISYKGRAKIMRPVHDAAEYRKLRDSIYQKKTVKRIREGEDELKRNLLQMNYSCLPNEDGTLKGTKRVSNTVGMDVDFVAPENLSAEEKQAWLKEKLASVPELVLAKKETLGLLMLERSATKGYHLVFKRRAGLTQEENLRWASLLLGMKYDEGAKDITRVFFTTTGSEEDLLFLSDELFVNETMADDHETMADDYDYGQGHLKREDGGSGVETMADDYGQGHPKRKGGASEVEESRSDAAASRHCERSEANQGSSSDRSGRLDCFVPRNDETHSDVAASRHCERSEANQGSSSDRSGRLDCFVPRKSSDSTLVNDGKGGNDVEQYPKDYHGV